MDTKVIVKFGVLLTAFSSLSACSLMWGKVPESRTLIVEKASNSLESEPVPGTVVGPWAETMYQDVDVPGTIDKRGVYYRMPHRSVVEIRPEKYQRAQYPDLDGMYRERE